MFNSNIGAIMYDISDESLKHICDLTLELTRLRQNEVKHLCVKEAATSIFARLLFVFLKRNVIEITHIG